MSRGAWVFVIVVIIAAIGGGFYLSSQRGTSIGDLLTGSSTPEEPSAPTTDTQQRYWAEVQRADQGKNELVVIYKEPAYTNPVTVKLTSDTKYYSMDRDGGNVNTAKLTDLAAGFTIQIESDPPFNPTKPDQAISAKNIFILR